MGARSKVQESAKDTELGYILLGKLSGSVFHDACSGSMYIDGHTWYASVSQGEIYGNIDVPAFIGTSLEQAGHTIAEGYGLTPTGFQLGYLDEVVFVRIEDFGSGECYRRFMDVTEPIQVSGVINLFN